MHEPIILSARDFIIGTGIAVGMATAFSLLSSGLSLIVTFVPGLAVAWLLLLWLYSTKNPLPEKDRLLPLYFAALALQFLHFAEEFATGFQLRFPAMYGGAAYSDATFVAFNMLAYAVFVLACLAVYYRGLRFLIVPPLFFIAYGAVGNAIAHTWWGLLLGEPFPGVYTAQAYWILGPLLLFAFLKSWWRVATVMLLYAVGFVPLLTFFRIEA